MRIRSWLAVLIRDIGGLDQGSISSQDQDLVRSVGLDQRSVMALDQDGMGVNAQSGQIPGPCVTGD